MREIKFRMWRDDRMSQLHEMHSQEENNNCFQKSERDGEIMQFTGLNDKYQIEVYESDIIKIDPDVAKMFNADELSVVRYINGGFYLNDCFIGFITDINYFVRGVVIGNVYDADLYLKSLSIDVSASPFVIHSGHKGFLQRDRYKGFMIEELIRIVAYQKGIAVITE